MKQRTLFTAILCLLMCLCLTASAAYETIEPGAKGQSVKDMQTRLGELGYYFNNADGGYGPKSQAALKRFQAGNGFEADGVATDAVLTRLYSEEAVPASRAPYLNDLSRKIEITADETVVYDGKTLKLTAETLNLTEDAPAQTALLWYSADPAIATVSAAGVVTGKDAGVAEIYCYAKDDEQICAAVEIEVRTSAKAIALDHKTLSLLMGGSEDSLQGQLVCTITPENAYDASVTWTSSDESVATVDENGVVRAVSMGTATITATPGDATLQKTAACAVTVSRSVESVTIDTASATLYTGKTLQLAAQALPEDATDRKIVWSSSDPAVATVNANGLVTAKTPGKITITATANDGSGFSAECELKVIAAVKTIAIEPKTAQLVLGSTEDAAQLKLTLKVTPENAEYKTATWASSDKSIATVDENGKVQALKGGKVTITATTTDPQSTATASAAITVGDSVHSIRLSKTSLRIQKGKSETLTATVGPEAALNKAVVWSSSNERIATVDARGRVSGKGCGEVTITAKAADGSGVKSECKVTVFQPVTGVAPYSSARETIFARKSVTLRAKVTPADASNKSLVWSSSDSGVATVDNTGKVEGRRAGTATITARAADGSGRSCTFRITVEPAVPIELESIGHGIYQFNLLGLTVTNKCKNHTIVDFDFDMELRSYSGGVINEGSFSLGSDVSIAPGATRTIKRTVYGAGNAYKTIITITGVSFRDGSYYRIPLELQDTWTFTRR